jgi:two-component system, chemotaxis family, protein-glutamate methylesterase/glutaminase
MPDESASEALDAVASSPISEFAAVAIATSAGGLTALARVPGSIPGSFPVPTVVVQHLDPRQRSLLAQIAFPGGPS